MLYSEQELCRVVRAMLKSIHLLVCLLVQDSGVLAVLDQLGVITCSLWTALLRTLSRGSFRSHSRRQSAVNSLSRRQSAAKQVA